MINYYQLQMALASVEDSLSSIQLCAALRIGQQAQSDPTKCDCGNEIAPGKEECQGCIDDYNNRFDEPDDGYDLDRYY